MNSHTYSTDLLHNCPTDLHNWQTINNSLQSYTKTELKQIYLMLKWLNNPNFHRFSIHFITITPTDSSNYIGVKFDNRLNFDKLIQTLKETTTYHLCNLFKLRRYINKKYFHITYKYINTITTYHFNNLLTWQTKTTILSTYLIILLRPP